MRKGGARKRFEVPRCRQIRHWFTYYGAPGSMAPVCQHCGVPNPYLKEDDFDRFDERERERHQAALHAMEAKKS